MRIYHILRACLFCIYAKSQQKIPVTAVLRSDAHMLFS